MSRKWVRLYSTIYGSLIESCREQLILLTIKRNAEFSRWCVLRGDIQNLVAVIAAFFRRF